MKLNLTAIVCAVCLFAACKKSTVKTTPLTSLNITNAVFGGTTAKLGSNATSISNNNFANMAVVAGENNLYIWPVGDSLHPYFTSNKFTSANGEVYSIFLTGIPSAPESVVVKENIPYRTDSTAGIRFINLSPNTNSKPINITLSTTPTVNEVSGLGYKQHTGFKTFEGKFNSSYTFQIRNDTSASPKAPLATFALTTSTVPRFANITVVIRQNGTVGVSTFRVNNDR